MSQPSFCIVPGAGGVGLGAGGADNASKFSELEKGEPLGGLLGTVGGTGGSFFLPGCGLAPPSDTFNFGGGVGGSFLLPSPSADGGAGSDFLMLLPS